MLTVRDALDDVFGFLLSAGSEASSTVLADLGLAHAAEATVALFEGDVTVAEALDYARVLVEHGRPVEAEEVFRQALAVAMSAVPQGAQLRWVTWAQGAQAEA